MFILNRHNDQIDASLTMTLRRMKTTGISKITKNIIIPEVIRHPVSKPKYLVKKPATIGPISSPIDILALNLN